MGSTLWRDDCSHLPVDADYVHMIDVLIRDIALIGDVVICYALS